MGALISKAAPGILLISFSASQFLGACESQLLECLADRD